MGVKGDIMEKLKKAKEVLQYNIWTLVIFEVFFKLLSFLFIAPLFVQSLNLTMTITGYHYLTFNNIGSFFINPITILFILIWIVLITFYTMFDITTVLLILDQSKQKKKVDLRDVLRPSFETCCRLLKLQNVPFVLLILCFILVSNLGVATSFVTMMNLLGSIIHVIMEHPILFSFALFLCFYGFLSWRYIGPYFVLEGMDFKEARQKSKQLSKKNHGKDGLYLLGIQLLLFLGFFLLIMIGDVSSFILNHLLGNWFIIKEVRASMLGSFCFVSFLGVPLSYATISFLFYIHKKENQEPIFHRTLVKTKEPARRKRLAMVFLAVFMIISLYVTHGISNGYVRLSSELEHPIELTAHRGASFQYPENTMLAFQGAKEFGADWIELDVQQTKDGKLIVLHDKNFKRTTGLNKKSWETTYEEIKDLDVGSFKDKKFSHARIPLLEEAIIWAKEHHIKLNIELKPTGHDIDFEKSVVDLVKQYDFQDQCVFASKTYSVLETIKQYDKNLQTLYVMSFVYGDVSSLKDADAFSIQAKSITASLVNSIHEEGKKIHAWTINTEEIMQQMINLKVDNIITDNIILAKDVLLNNQN